MNRYEEICEASNNAEKKWNEYRERSFGYLITIAQGLVTHCGVPLDKIFFLRSNNLPGDERRYSPPHEGGLYSVPGAATFEEDEYWHLGVGVMLSPTGTFPERWIGAVVCVTEDDGQAQIKIGVNGKPRTLDLSDPKQCARFCDEFAVFLKERYDNPRKITKQIGYPTMTNPKQGERQVETTD